MRECEWCGPPERTEASVKVTDHRGVSVFMCEPCYLDTWESDMVRWNGGRPKVEEI